MDGRYIVMRRLDYESGCNIYRHGTNTHLDNL